MHVLRRTFTHSVLPHAWRRTRLPCIVHLRRPCSTLTRGDVPGSEHGDRYHIEQLLEKHLALFKSELKSIKEDVQTIKSNVQDVKNDVLAAKTEVLSKMDGVKAELVARMDGVKAEVTARSDGVKAEVAARSDGVKAEVAARTEGIKHEFNAKMEGHRAESKVNFDYQRIETAAVRAVLAERITSVNTRMALGWGVITLAITLFGIWTRYSPVCVCVESDAAISKVW
jgi:hypothetical protein